ncbi:YggT family protein [Leucobacter luti]|uniref:YggT family protein n=1 Tax=Leucobacter luti TaxID=340320 RepID=A0A4R6RZQ0_9MICO|nr:YggT family protein [Leucobacter luti]MCW2287580.1 YggT family protein [Leucobacter luti]QYM76388.1 YggT family protein [Leucobacter luti]TCK46252.1 YggT family protein [Leucobacter luti]TDP92681.1 YggT family protein [Leucobacter luti]
MEFVLVVGGILKLLLRIYTLVLWVRFVLDWIMVLNRRFRPRGPLAVAIELVYTVTDPPIRMFRRLLPPIRLGQVSLDLGWMLTMLACWILIAIIPGW